jgi:hypothetical protein
MKGVLRICTIPISTNNHQRSRLLRYPSPTPNHPRLRSSDNILHPSRLLLRHNRSKKLLHIRLLHRRLRGIPYRRRSSTLYSRSDIRGLFHCRVWHVPGYPRSSDFVLE